MTQEIVCLEAFLHVVDFNLTVRSANRDETGRWIYAKFEAQRTKTQGVLDDLTTTAIWPPVKNWSKAIESRYLLRAR